MLAQSIVKLFFMWITCIFLRSKICLTIINVNDYMLSWNTEDVDKQISKINVKL